MRQALRWCMTVLGILLGTAAASAQDQKITLGLHLQAGKSYNLRTSVDQQISQTIDDKKIDIIQIIGLDYVYAVLAVDADGTAAVQVTYKGVQFRNQGPMGITEYDSTDPPRQIPPAAKGYAALVGESFTMKMLATGRISEVQGVDAMLTRMIGKLDLPDGPLKTDLTNSLKNQFGDQALKAAMENLTAIYPGQPVGTGDTWQKNITVDKGFPMSLAGTWTLKERKHGVAMIAVHSTIQPNPNAQPIQLGQVKVKYALAGEMNGMIEMDEATGWTNHGQMTQRVSGQITLLGAAPGQKDSSWPITIKSLIRMDSDATAIDAHPAAR